MKIIIIFVLSFYFAIGMANANSLNEISRFAKEICDDIRPEGKINKEEVEAKLKGNIKGVAKLIGGSVNIDGTLSSEKMEYNGLPYESLPSVMKDARECKQDIAKMLISELSTMLVKKQSVKRKISNNNLYTIASNFKFLLDECTKENQAMTCSILVTNLSKKYRNLIVYPHSLVFNYAGEQFQASTVSLVDTSGLKLMFAGLPMKLKLRFESAKIGEKIFRLQIFGNVSRMKHQRFTAELREVPVSSAN